MTKAELEAENRKLKAQISKVEQGFQHIINNYCEDSHDPIKDFCAITGFKVPNKEINITIEGLKLPLGVDFDYSLLELTYDGNSVEFESVKED